MNMFNFLLLASRFDSLNKLGDEHPTATGMILLIVGGALIGYGVHGLRTGVAKDRWGFEFSGGMANLTSAARFLGGIAAVIGATFLLVPG